MENWNYNKTNCVINNSCHRKLNIEHIKGVGHYIKHIISDIVVSFLSSMVPDRLPGTVQVPVPRVLINTNYYDFQRKNKNSGS